MPKGFMDKASFPLDFDIIDGTDPVVNNLGWWLVEVHNDSVVFEASGIVINGTEKDITALNADIAKGDTFYGLFTSIHLSAGIVKAYRFPTATS